LLLTRIVVMSLLLQRRLPHQHQHRLLLNKYCGLAVGYKKTRQIALGGFFHS
jgi:hypothetical protein